ncbi:MAG: cupin domain-containing protein [Lewinellaceae bacterium]|nr:cupin domain-containing protein [Lewinellaceae bacterium]
MNTTTVINPIISLPGAGPKLSVLGVEVYFKAKVSQTNGLWSMIEYHLPPSPMSPPLHYHKEMQEIFYVLEGQLQFTLEGEIINAPAGSLVMIPAGAVHTFRNGSDQLAKFQVWFSPGGFEQYFLDMQELIASEPTWPPQDMSIVFALLAKHDTFPPEH